MSDHCTVCGGVGGQHAPICPHVGDQWAGVYYAGELSAERAKLERRLRAPEPDPPLHWREAPETEAIAARFAPEGATQAERGRVESLLEDTHRLWGDDEGAMLKWFSTRNGQWVEAVGLETAAAAGRLRAHAERVGAPEIRARCKWLRKAIEKGMTGQAEALIKKIEQDMRTRKSAQRALFDAPAQARTPEGRALERAVRNAAAWDACGPIARRGRTSAEETAGLALEGSALAWSELEETEAGRAVARALNAFAQATPERVRTRWREDHARGGLAAAKEGMKALSGEVPWAQDHESVVATLEQWKIARTAGMANGLEIGHEQARALIAAGEAGARGERGEVERLPELERALVERALAGPCPEERTSTLQHTLRMKVLYAKGDSAQAQRESAMAWTGTAIAEAHAGKLGWDEAGLEEMYANACANPAEIERSTDTANAKCVRRALGRMQPPASPEARATRNALTLALAAYEDIERGQRRTRIRAGQAARAR